MPYCGVVTVFEPLRVFPRAPVAVPETVVVPFPLFTALADPVDVPPFGPFTVPVAVFVPLPLFVVEPVAVVVLPFAPVTVADPAAPLRVLVAVTEPDTVLPRALVAVPVAVAVLPFVTTVPVAVPPCFPVTVRCANAAGSTSESVMIVSTVRMFFIESP
jgi:hypothetical protein